MPGDATFNNLTVNSGHFNGGMTTTGTHVVTGTADVNVLNVSGTTTLNNVNIAGTAQYTNLSLPGTLSVTGTSTLGDVNVSGLIQNENEAWIKGVLNTTKMVPYGQYVPDSQDVFVLNNDGNVIPPSCTERDYIVPIPMFTDSSKTTYVNKGTTNPSDPKSVLVDFPTGNVYAPRVTKLSNASINTIYKDIYSNANQTFNVSSHFSAQPLTTGYKIFSDSDFNQTFSNIIGYYTDRGFTIAPPDYTVNFKNMFMTNILDTGSPSINGTYCIASIEFGYDISTSIPSNVYVTASNFNGIGSFQTENHLFYTPFFPTYKALAETNSNLFLQPVTIPVTTDPAVFASAYGTSTGKQALYDAAKKEIHIYFNGSSNTYGSGNTTPAFTSGTGIPQITWNEVCELSHFEGSFALKKKRADLTDSNRPFAPANSVDETTFLVQTSNNIIITSNVFKNGTQMFPSASQTVSYGNYSATVRKPMLSGGSYAGAVFAKIGNGTSNYDAFSFNKYIANAFQSTLNPVIIDKNPYSDIIEYYTLPSRVTLYNSNAIAAFTASTSYSNLYTDTPEALAANMSPSSITPTNGAKVAEFVLAHEISHGFRDAGLGFTGRRVLLNAEGHATSAEMSYMKKIMPEVIDAFRCLSWASYLNTFNRGAYPLEYRFNAFEGQLHTLGTSQDRVYAIQQSQYGESMFFNYVLSQYDTNQQIEKYFGQIYNQKLKEGVIDAGFPTWLTFYASSIKAPHLALDAAIKTVTASTATQKSLAEVYTDFVVSLALMRNNSTIPDKYKTSYPYWVYNRNAPWISNLQAASVWATTTDCLIWSDSLDGIPIGQSAQAAALGYNWAIGGTQNDTLVPIWPKEGTSALPFSNGPVLNNLGSWANPVTRDTWTYTSNTYVSTPLVHQLEDMASFTYVMPIFSDSANLVYGTQNYVSNVAITVQRGDWVFKVVQFVPDGADGTFIQSDDINVKITDDTFTLDANGGAWSGGTTQTIDINFSTIATTTTTSSGTVNTTGFQKYCHGTDWHGAHVWYFPRLLCINKKNYDYGPYRNVYPRRCIYTGYMTMQATVV
jgi:hypothetical protein